MAKLWKSLSEKGKKTWPEIYKHFTGKEWNPLTEDGRAIHCEGKLEDLKEVDRQMREKPNYAIDKQGREG